MPRPIYLGWNADTMKQAATILLLLLAMRPAIGQDILFKSNQSFTTEQMDGFYSSFRISGNWIIYNGADYKLYGYDRLTQQLKWTYELNRKSDIAPFVVGEQIWANAKDRVVKLDLQSGQWLKDLPIASVDTEPFTMDGKLFCTGIQDGGKIFEFDPVADSVLWSRFLAHGSSAQPFYLKNRIVANAEGYRWLEFDYTGKYLSRNCDVETSWPSDNPCAKSFITLSHDGKEITEKFAAALGLGEASRFYLPHKTFLICEKRLVILGDGLKVLLNKELNDVSDELLGIYGSDIKILTANDEKVWIYESDRIIEYNYKLKKFVRSMDLAEWSPHQVTLDHDKVWLISKTDGLLYAISFNGVK
ncbi:MAG: hypothetical protein EOO05_08135 [Chitinophagaceae bacterium]|nr:MAG: hypothetical protein EOO05_08135 [Chitinophagaceae bacterium]